MSQSTLAASLLGQGIAALLAHHGRAATVTRHTRTRQGGGFSAPPTAPLGPYTVALAQRGSRVALLVTEAGLLNRDADWLLLGGPDVDVQPPTALRWDTLPAPAGGTLRVRDVRPSEWHGERVGVQAELEWEG